MSIGSWMKAGLRQVTCIVRERQLRLYGHMARLPAEDLAHRNFSCRGPSGWTMPRGVLSSMVTSGVVVPVGYWHGGTGVCFGDVETEAEGVPSVFRA